MATGSNAQSGDQAAGKAAQQTPTLEGRTSLGKYRITRPLGAGGMGTVYLAVDSDLKRTVALKVLPKERTQNETLVRRFQAEAQASAQLKHENIVTVYDAGKADGHLYIALEYVDGADIHEVVVKRGPLPLKRTIDYIRQVAHALEHLHKRGFVHRDIKPSNLLLTKEGTVKVTDMGLARAVDESLKSNITREGTTVGTVDYMAPEQARNSQAADIRSDIYSLGCTWYQMLTGEPPYPAGSVTNKLFAHISKPRPDPRAINSSISEEIVAVLHRMMARKPADRYQTPTDLIRDLDELAKGKSRLDELFKPDIEEAPATAAPAREPPPAAPTMPPRQSPPRQSPPRESPRGQSPLRSAPPDSGREADNSGRHRLPARQRDSDAGEAVPAQNNAQDNSERQRMPAPSRQMAPSKSTGAPRRASTVAEPVAVRRRSKSGGAQIKEEKTPIDWRPLATKAGAAAGGLLSVGLLVWLGFYFYGQSNQKPPEGNGLVSPFAPHAGEPDKAAHVLPAEKGDADKKENAGKKPGDKETGKVLVDAKKPVSDERVAVVLGTPKEREQFPEWVRQAWDPSIAADSASLPVLTVGRVDEESPAKFASLSDAIAKLPQSGGIIELRGPGPFLLRPLRIANHGRVIITGVPPREERTAGGGPKNLKTAAAVQPVIALLPSTGSAADSGIVATDCSWTFYGVHLVAFADLYPADTPVRLIEVQSGDLTVRRSSLTLVGSRSGSTSAFVASTPSAFARADHPPQILLDRVVVRGNGLTAVDADLRAVDLLAINSLFVTAKAPALNLSLGPQGAPDLGSASQFARNLRLFSCTTYTEGPAITVHADNLVGAPPTTRFQLLNSVLGTAYGSQASMIALNNWPVRAPAARPPYQNLHVASESFVARGWKNFIQTDNGVALGTDSVRWPAFWDEARSTLYFQPEPFPTLPDAASADLSHFNTQTGASSPSSAWDTHPPGCDLQFVTVERHDIAERARAFAQRPQLPAQFAGEPEAAGTREIDLDKEHWKDLARFINLNDWKSGTRFVVHSSRKHDCGPIHVNGKSLCIEFASDAPLFSFEPQNEKDAFIKVTGGTIEIVNANFRIGPSTKPSPHWFLDVQDGSFSIRNCTLQGQIFENATYSGLIHFSAGRSATSASDTLAPHWGHVRNSFLFTTHTVLGGDMAADNLMLEDSILVSSARVFDLRLGSSSPAIDIHSCTLSAGTDHFHFKADPSAARAPRPRIFVEDTVFAPPVRPDGDSTSQPALIGGVTESQIADRLDWWEYACAYSRFVTLPGQVAGNSGAAGALDAWSRLAGPAHILRSTDAAGAVILKRDLPQLKETVPSDFRLQALAKAATWSDLGTPIGANQVINAPPSVKRPVPAAKTPAAERKAPPPTKGSGL